MPTMANDALDKVRPLQRRLYRAAKQGRARRFHALFDKVHRRDVLERAWSEVAAHGGAAGVDGQTIDEIRHGGVGEFLARLQVELREGTYRPLGGQAGRDPQGPRAASACSASRRSAIASCRRP